MRRHSIEQPESISRARRRRDYAVVKKRRIEGSRKFPTVSSKSENGTIVQIARTDMAFPVRHGDFMLVMRARDGRIATMPMSYDTFLTLCRVASGVLDAYEPIK